MSTSISNSLGNNIIQSLWIGPTLSLIEQLCIKSFIHFGHEFHLYAYDHIDNVPRETVIMDANTIIPEDQIFMDSTGGVASFADYFRYKLLYEQGGWWVDMDSICIRPFDIMSEYCFSSEFTMKNQRQVNIGVLKSPAKAEFLKDILNYVEAIDKNDIVWGEFGPLLFEKILRNYDSLKYIMEPEVFCPINWFEIQNITENVNYKIPDNALAIHLWNERWRVLQLDKNAAYHESSVFEILKRKFNKKI